MTQIANAYAQGLYALAGEETLQETILQQMEALREAFDREPGFYRLLSAPNISKQEKIDVVDTSLRDKVHPYLLNFLKILTERGYAAAFSKCCDAFRRQYNAEFGILPVQAVTAVPLNPGQIEKLTEKMSAITGKTVLLTNVADPACLGGVRLDYDGKRVDGTVKNRLNSIAAVLKNTV